jgi:hypothetical protein
MIALEDSKGERHVPLWVQLVMEAIGKGDGASQAIRKCDGLKSSCLASTCTVDALHERDGLHQLCTQGQTTFSFGGRRASDLDPDFAPASPFLPSILAALFLPPAHRRPCEHVRQARQLAGPQQTTPALPVRPPSVKGD